MSEIVLWATAHFRTALAPIAAGPDAVADRRTDSIRRDTMKVQRSMPKTRP